MDRTKENDSLLCAQMPEVAEIITSARFMPGLSEETRQDLQETILSIEGSPRDGGMTCVAIKDLPPLVDKILEGIQNDELTNQYITGYRTRLHGYMRNLNRHCDECSSVCQDRVKETRQELLQISRTNYTNSRRSKVTPPVAAASSSMISSLAPRRSSSIPAPVLYENYRY